MGSRTARRTPVNVVHARARVVLTLTLGIAVSGGPRTARADRNDLQLANLCSTASGRCPWVTGLSAPDLALDMDRDGTPATSRFRSLMSELGVVIAPRLQTPADTLGFAGFQIAAEVGMTQISRNRSYWDGVQGVNPSNATASRPAAWLTTVGAFVRKGMWFPIPALEWGVGAVNILQSGLWAIQGYMKLAVQEGFHDWVLPSIAVRGGVSQLVGTDQVTLTVSSIDVLISKAFSLAGTARIEPFAGWDFLFIDARSGVIDLTPGCDAFLLHQTSPGGTAPVGCPAGEAAGTWADLNNGNFTFPRQDIITRNQFYAGAKLKLAMLFVVGQFTIAPAGSSHDGRNTSDPARDVSATQRSLSVSAGFDF